MDPEFIALSIIILLFSVIVHEVMHGWVARFFGDHTAEDAGRLTLNPIPHIDPIGTVLLPGLLFLTQSPIMFGWAKPVPVNPLNFRNIKKGEILTSFAGVGANLVLAIIAAILFHTMRATGTDSTILQALFFAVNINLLLAVFNLIPIPPLDGSKVLMALLPLNIAIEFQKLERYGFIFLLLLWIVPVGNTTLLSFILGNGTSILKRFLGF